MKTTKFRQGHHIRVRHPQGSVGVVDDVANGIVYVTFHFGLDVHGKPITASAGCRAFELERISKAAFEATAEKPAWERSPPDVPGRTRHSYLCPALGGYDCRCGFEPVRRAAKEGA